jgi:lipid-binding SYLF domain-containing protein
MTRILIAIAAAALLMPTSDPARGQDEEIADLREATAVFEETLDMRESGIPRRILDDAHAVAILPGVVKVGFVVGGRRGSGVLLVRREDGSWSAPAFLSLTGGSFGLQAGASSTDVVLVFRNRGGVQSLLDGKTTLGGTISVAAGPTGRNAEAATDGRLRAELYAYSRSRGAFAGLSLEGATLQFSKASNRRVYGTPSAAAILYGDRSPPEAAARLSALLLQSTQ